MYMQVNRAGGVEACRKKETAHYQPAESQIHNKLGTEAENYKHMTSVQFEVNRWPNA